jgi:hypothetical protein
MNTLSSGASGTAQTMQIVTNSQATPYTLTAASGQYFYGNTGSVTTFVVPPKSSVIFFGWSIGGTFYWSATNCANTNQISGTFVASGTTGTAVSDTRVTANSTISFGLNTAGGTILGAPYVSSQTAGTGFTVKAGASDTSTYNYTITN